MLTHLLESWGSLYANHSALRTGIEFMHIGGLVAGGGCAIAADRTTLLSAREDVPTRMIQLRFLKSTHRIVVIGLVIVTVSGLLLFGADVDTFLYSKVFWLKMGLILLLLANGAFLLRSERRAESGDRQAWNRLTFAATASLVLWFLTTLAGAALPNIG